MKDLVQQASELKILSEGPNHTEYLCFDQKVSNILDPALIPLITISRNLLLTAPPPPYKHINVHKYDTRSGNLQSIYSQTTRYLYMMI